MKTGFWFPSFASFRWAGRFQVVLGFLPPTPAPRFRVLLCSWYFPRPLSEFGEGGETVWGLREFVEKCALLFVFN
ncbi:MAG: hypothetical protein B6D64_04020 [Bacteroidetes bacterium 4484_276]|nr:MAG: hypothetical protein B6D64_04020 [Bacteroidetes bacterium 4484_276]